MPSGCLLLESATATTDEALNPTSLVRVASGEVVEMSTGTISSLQVGGALTSDVTVLVKGVPLLGKNFISEYNLMMGQISSYFDLSWVFRSYCHHFCLVKLHHFSQGEAGLSA